MNEDYYALIEAELERAMACPGIPDALGEAMRYSLMGDGKRLRPAMCLACCELVGGDVRDALPLCGAIEMIQTYSLIHDDLPCMDDDDMRRGKPSSHIVFGEAGAVLAGDALLSHAFFWMLENAPREPVEAQRYMRAMRCIAYGAGAEGMVAGQSLELSGALERGEATLFEVQRKKTGALLLAAALAGGEAGGMNEEQNAALTDFAKAYGALFQATDDMIDADAERNDQKNVVAVYGMEHTRRLCEGYARECLEALEKLGGGDGFLAELTKKTLIRNR